MSHVNDVIADPAHTEEVLKKYSVVMEKHLKCLGVAVPYRYCVGENRHKREFEALKIVNVSNTYAINSREQFIPHFLWFIHLQSHLHRDFN